MRNQTLAFLIVLSFVWIGGCSSPPKVQERPITFAPSAQQVIAKKLWTRKVPGLLTDLNLSRDGSTILVATVPDRDSTDPNANHSAYFATFYSRGGKNLSQIQMPAQIKSQSISDDGRMAVISSYDDMIRAYDRDGKQLWETNGFCKPTILSRLKKIVCFHDDDEEPEIGFEVLDFAGKKLEQFPIKNDALVMKFSPNQRFAIMAMTGGKVVIFDQHLKPVLRKKLPGEIVDVGIAEGLKKPIYAVLYYKKRSDHQLVQYFGKKSHRIDVEGHLSQIELSPWGKAIFGYSNSTDSQILARLGFTSANSWTREDAHSAEFSSQIVAEPETVWMGYEDETPKSHVLGFDYNGGLRTNIPVPAEEGAFLYTFSVAPGSGLIAIGSDDAHLSLFEMRKK